MMKSKQIGTVEDYLTTLSKEQRAIAETLRETIKNGAPDAEEIISYQMPAYRYNGILIYFGIYKKHVGLYPTSSGIEAFKKKLTSYITSKGTVQFPLDKPLPLHLITEIVRFRLKENKQKHNERR